MLKKGNKLTIKYYNGSTYTNYSNELLDFGRDTVSLTLANTDFLYVGYFKSISDLYAELSTANTTDTTFSVEYYNGTTWADVSGLFDESNSFQRSGFISWNRNLSDEQKTTIDGDELFWYRLQPALTHSASVLDGLNIVFADDQDLKKEFFEISQYIPTGANSHILTHLAVRDEIIQDIRRDGRFVLDNNTGYVEDIDAYDLLNIDQINQAATYLALSKIFFNIADNGDATDVYIYKRDQYMAKFKNAMQLFFLSIDTDNDGQLDQEERAKSYTPTLARR